MLNVKIYGAGSIGNHLAHASRSLGWQVTVSDVDRQALRRMRSEIYPSRYGRWDDEITLVHNDEAPRGGFDLIAIGTPPASHIPLALAAIEERPAALLIEKPLATPDLAGLQELWERGATVQGFVGYDHAVGKAAQIASDWIRRGRIGDVLTIDVDFREHWGGIFTAHPWLDGPADSYLGYWRQGGGALGEHSHAINLWQHLAHAAGAGRVVEVSARVKYVADPPVEYDDEAYVTLTTESGLVGRVVQDVITRPTRKLARVQGTEGTVEWVAGLEPGVDGVLLSSTGGSTAQERLRKSRPDDFIQELRFIADRLRRSNDDTSIDLSRGIDTMLVVAAAHQSEGTKCPVRIDYARGYSRDALVPVQTATV